MKRFVLDLGMNNGDDTEYYLAKNYDVVAVEANIYLCDVAKMRFSRAISEGRLTILNNAITEATEDCIFYINTENHHWSSLDINWAARNNSNVVAHTVRGINLSQIITTYGCPYFLKIDIEGGDMSVLKQLLDTKQRPQFISIEDCRFGFEYINLLHKIGYKKFKLSNQMMVPMMKDNSVEHSFKLGSSGMFGDELHGEWKKYESFLDIYAQTVRSRESLLKISSPEVWWDIHCSR